MSLVKLKRTAAVLATDVLELDVAREQWSADSPQFSSDPEARFNAQLSSFNGVLDIENNPIPNKLNYRILNNSYSFSIEPIVFNNNLNIKLRSIKINLPDKILSNCFVINSFTSGDKTFIVTDSITEVGLLITTILDLSYFVQGGKHASDLSSDNQQEWCRISNPYGFDIRKPHMLYSYSYDYSVVLLKDGGIIGLKKNVSDFSFEPIVFNDNSYLESLGQILKPWSRKPIISGDSSLSEKAAVDVLHFRDLLITVTINRKLRVWSMSSQSLILEKDLTQLTTVTTNKLFFDSTPSKFLDLLTIGDGDDAYTYLSIFLPFGEGIFKIFQFQTSPALDIQDLGDRFEIKSSLPESTTIWSVGDFKLTSSSDALQLWVLWKSNTSSIIQSLDIGQSTSSEWIEAHQSIVLPNHKLNNETSSEYYSRKIFHGGIYGNEIIETALPIFEAHFSQTSVADVDENLLDDFSLVERVTRSVGKAIQFDKNYEFNLKKQWSRFDSLCHEFKKQADEPLKLIMHNDLVLLSNRAQFSLIRPLCDLEYVNYNKSSAAVNTEKSELLKFADIIHQFRNTLGKDVQNNVKNSLLKLIRTSDPNSVPSDRFASIYDEQINEKLNPNNLGTLVSQLDEFDNVFQHITTLLELQKSSSIHEPLVKSKLTSLSISSIITSTREIINTNMETLLDLVIVLLVLDFDDKKALRSTISKILRLVRNYQIAEASFEINFNPSTNKLELNEASQISNNLFAKILNLVFAKGTQFNSAGLLNFIQGSILPFIHTDVFLQKLCIWLISNDYSYIVHQTFADYLSDSPIHYLLKSIVLLKVGQSLKSSSILIDKSLLISQYKLSTEEKETFKPLEDFVVFFHSNLTKYYLNLAILFLNNLQFVAASRFIQKSITTRSNIVSDPKFNELKYHTYLTISIELSDFESAVDALKYIDNPKLKDECLNKIIYQLYKTSSIRKLNDLEFGKNELKVDEILQRKARNSKGYSKALFFYKASYAYRLKLKNFRGAAESLYEFIYKYKELEDIRFIIADLYIVIMNLVSTFDEDNQWIIFTLENGENDVLSYESLKNEFNNFTSSFTKLDKSKYGLY